MATQHAGTQLTITEAAKRVHDGKMLPIAEILQTSRPMLQHAVWVEANSMFTNVTTQRYNIPAGSWRKFNAGVAAESSQTKQITDQIGMLESYAEHDKALVDSMPNPGQFRTDENVAFIEGLGQTMASQAIYGNALVDPEKWTGLAPRMASLNSKTIQGCSGTGSDLSSLYFIQWRADRVFMTYPPGSAAGLQHEPLGQTTKTDSDGYMWEVYRDHFVWKCGLVVRDPRCIARVCNMETSGSSNIFDDTILIAVVNWMRDQGRGAIGYCNTTIYTQIENDINNKSNVFHTVKNPYGEGEVPSLKGIPIYVEDAILNTETALT